MSEGSSITVTLEGMYSCNSVGIRCYYTVSWPGDRAAAAAAGERWRAAAVTRLRQCDEMVQCRDETNIETAFGDLTTSFSGFSK